MDMRKIKVTIGITNIIGGCLLLLIGILVAFAGNLLGGLINSFGGGSLAGTVITVIGVVIAVLGALNAFLGLKFCSHKPQKVIAIIFLVIYIIGTLSIILGLLSGPINFYNMVPGLISLLFVIALVYYLINMRRYYGEQPIRQNNRQNDSQYVNQPQESHATQQQAHIQDIHGKWVFDEMFAIENGEEQIVSKHEALGILGDEVSDTYFYFRDNGTAIWTILSAGTTPDRIEYIYEVNGNDIMLETDEGSTLSAEIENDLIIFDMSNELEIEDAFWVFRKV